MSVARPRRLEDRSDFRMAFRISRDERLALEELAAQACVPISEFCRQKLLSQIRLQSIPAHAEICKGAVLSQPKKF